MPERAIGKFERLARERHEKDLALAAQPGGHPRGLWFDQPAADRVIQFIEKYCRHYEGEWAGRRIVLEEWQKRDIISPIFGWKRADGTRRYRIAYIEVPRKNGKSFLVSALCLYLLIADQEPGAQVYSFATKEEQAAIVWRGADAMIDQSPDLQRFVNVHGKKKKTGGTIFCDRMRSFFRPLGADSRTLDGLNPHASAADELHEHKSRHVWVKLATATGARRQPLQLAITTAGIYDPESIGWQEHKYATDVLEGAFEDDARFAFIAAADDKDDVFSVETQKKANPNFGVSAKPSTLADTAALARRQPTTYNDYLRYHLNRWVQQITRWLPVEQWEEADPLGLAAALERRADAEKSLLGLACWGGLDLSSKLDLTAFVLAFPREGNVIEFLCRFWLPENKVQDELKKGRAHYELWAREGWLTLTSGDVIDYDVVRAEIVELGKKYSIQEIAFDPSGATQISTQLANDGFTMVEFRQGMLSMTEPSKDFEARVVAKQVRHGGNPILRWNVGNAVVKRDAAGNIKPDKEKATGKIDGVVAAIMAAGRANLGSGNVASAYSETRGLRTL